MHPNPPMHWQRSPEGVVTIHAPAKVNLTLRVLGKRPDGYHALASVMLAVDLADTLELAPAPGPGPAGSPEGRLELTCDAPGLQVDEDNLVLRAARLLQRHTGTRQPARMHLRKRIPWAAGLGGGSSDAASALVGLNMLWGLGLSPAELAGLGGRLGSDVPFFFAAPLAWCWGRGEFTRPLGLGAECWLVLVAPRAGLSTPAVFRELACPVELGGAADAEPPLDPRLEAALESGDRDEICRHLHNDLQAAAMRLSPAVRHWHRRLEAAMAGRAGVLMSGSGSSLFALCRDREHARRIAEEVRREEPSEGPESARVEIVRTWSKPGSTPR